MNILKLTACVFAIATSKVLLVSSAMAGCGSGSIEVNYGGSETCVKPQQFVTLSPAVQATADAEDVAEAMTGDDDSNGQIASNHHAGSGHNNAAADDDKSDDTGDDSSGGDSSHSGGSDNHSSESHGSGGDSKGGDD